MSPPGVAADGDGSPVRASVILSVVGAWRSLVAHLNGVQEVERSNRSAPTITWTRERPPGPVRRPLDSRPHPRSHPRRPPDARNRFNRSASGLVVILPLTSADRGIPWHVRVAPEDGEVRQESWAMVDQLRVVSRERLVGDPWGRASSTVMATIEERLRLLLGLA